MIVSMYTDQWVYLFSGSVPSTLAGIAGIFLILKQKRRLNQEEV